MRFFFWSWRIDPCDAPDREAVAPGAGRELGFCEPQEVALLEAERPVRGKRPAHDGEMEAAGEEGLGHSPGP